MNGRVFRRCGCRGENGRQLGSACPKLGTKGHGTWNYVVDVPGANGKRKQLKRGGFPTKKAATDDMAQRLDLAAHGVRVDERQTVGQWLDEWVTDRTDPSGISGLGGKPIRPNTATGYRQHIKDYLKPHLGNIPMAKLTADDISRAYRTITEQAKQKSAKAEQRAALLNSARARDGLPEQPLRPVRVCGPTTLRRVHACLRAALQAAVRARRIPYNPAQGVTLPTPPRTEVKPWQAADLGRFLDHIQGYRLAVLFETIAATGLLRGEALGLNWSDLDVERATLTIRRQLVSQHGGRAEFGPTKTATGERVVELDATTMGAILGHRLAQDAERIRWASAYDDHDLVFCQEDGRPLDPSAVTKLFSALAAEAELPHIRLHDLRHGQASLMLAAGIPVEVVSKRLGHSSIGITLDTYSHLLEGVGRRAAEAAMGLVPRAKTTAA